MYKIDNISLIESIEKQYLNYNYAQHDIQYLLKYNFYYTITNILRNSSYDTITNYLFEAGQCNRLSIIEYIATNKLVNLTLEKNLLLRMACRMGYFSIVQYLCELPAEYKIDPTVKGNYCISIAATNRHVDIVRYLYDIDKVYDFLSEHDRIEYRNLINGI